MVVAVHHGMFAYIRSSADLNSLDINVFHIILATLFRWIHSTVQSLIYIQVHSAVLQESIVKY
jgi:hypothetical protein